MQLHTSPLHVIRLLAGIRILACALDVTAQSAPVFIAEPMNVSTQTGASIELRSTVSDTPPGGAVTYQWRRNGTAIEGATKAFLNLVSVLPENAGTYTAVATNAVGSTTSRACVVGVDSPTATAYTVATHAGGPAIPAFVDGAAFVARFSNPSGIAVHQTGDVYVMDGGNSAVRKISRGAVSTVANVSGWGIAVDVFGNVFVADFLGARILKINTQGSISTFAGTGERGHRDGPAAQAQFRTPRGIALDQAGNIFVADSENFVIRKITPAGMVSTIAGAVGVQQATGGPGSEARFTSPWGLAVDPNGSLYIADRVAVVKITSQGIVERVVGGSTGSADGQGGSASFNLAVAVAVDRGGNLFVADTLNNLVRKVSQSGMVTTIAGAAGQSGTTDGVGAAARFSGPFGVAVDHTGVVFVTDNGNHTVRSLTPSASTLSLLSTPGFTHVSEGSRATLQASAEGPDLAIQWLKDGAVIPGATAATLVIASAKPVDMGTYTVSAHAGGSSIEVMAGVLTVAAPGQTSALVNVATRGIVQSGGTLTAGFVVRGSAPKRLLLRGVGPTLSQFSLAGTLANPRFDVTPLGSSSIILSNDDWSDTAAMREACAACAAFPLAPLAKDAASTTTIDPQAGTGYTMTISATEPSASGLVLAEIYDAEPTNTATRLINLSTLGHVGQGAAALIPGFVIVGDGPKQILIRAIGPKLASYSVPNSLADPQIAIVQLGKSTPLARNDNWGGTTELKNAFRKVGAFELDSDSRDAALVTHVPPGGYTLIVSGVGGGVGTALVEVYDMD